MGFLSWSGVVSTQWNLPGGFDVPVASYVESVELVDRGITSLTLISTLSPTGGRLPHHRT